MTSPDEWLRRIGSLKVDRASGDPAPHKPLLLLVLLDVAAEGMLPNGPWELTPQIAFRFLTFWSIVAHRRRQRPDVRYPFHHLASDGFWNVAQDNGEPSPHRRLTRFAFLDPSFREFLSSPQCRDRARETVIRTYFRPGERTALRAMLDLPPEQEEGPLVDLDRETTEAARTQGREARFRLTVVAAYNYTCALTSYRLTTVTGMSIVDAAHIHRFSDSRNNDPRNGIALCKNAHWMFDIGLWTLNDDCTVRVAIGHFDESSSSGLCLRDLDGERITLPEDVRWWPKSEYLDWHRRKVFLGR